MLSGRLHSRKGVRSVEYLIILYLILVITAYIIHTKRK